MSKAELNNCLKLFYTSARQKDGSYYKKTTMKSIRAAIERFLKKKSNKGFGIVGDPTFAEANAVLDAFVKDLRKSGKITGTVHKKTISKEEIQQLFRAVELGPADTVDPAQLFRTVWFHLNFYFGIRGRENQRNRNQTCLS
jgi:histone H3/H4